MIYQHFYSRVPARKSMFRHTDGYDTFAKSEELEEEFIENELSAICDYRPTKYENILIWENKLPPVYCRFTAQSGEAVLSCLSYIPRDYTNERSSFLVHSLILDGEDKRRALYGIGTKIIDPSAFVHDIGCFNLTSSAPVVLPEVKEYAAARVGSLQPLAQNYTPKVMKRFIFALLCAACGKGKPIYVTLGKNASEVSQMALDLMNAVLQIFPGNIRENISFITYLSDYTKLNGFKVKFLPPDCMGIPSGKGYIFDNMSARAADGIRDEDYHANEVTVEFFYGLLTDAALRNSFLRFCDRAAEKDASLREPKLKSIAGLVFLFRQYSNKFTEKEVLPDDGKVYELFCIYEKYCDALTPSERSVVLSCLNRYLRLHMPIPQNIFSKFCKLYPKEPPRSRTDAMKIILEMIHTDIMRDKLFAFIRNNYANEEKRSRSLICKDLCSVFYGGFLQPQILALFSQYFTEEEEPVRNMIVEKLLLTIRTAAIQDKILEFFETHRDVLTPRQKKKLYDTAYEMLSYGDDLSQKLVRLLDLCFADESAESQASARGKIMEAVMVSRRKKSSRLLEQIMAADGFCKETVIRSVVTEHASQKIFEDLLGILCGGKITDFIGEFRYLRSIVTEPSEQADRRMYAILCELLPETLRRSDLYGVLSADDDLHTRMIGAWNGQTDALCTRISEALLRPYAEECLCDAFRTKLRADGVEFLFEYALHHEYITRCENYRYLQAYAAIFDAIEAGDARKVADCFCDLPSAKSVCAEIAVCIDRKLHTCEQLLSGSSEVVTAYAAAMLLKGGLQKGLQFESVFDELSNLLAAVLGHTKQYAGRKEKILQASANVQAYEAIVFAGEKIVESGVSEDIKNKFVGGETNEPFVGFLRMGLVRLGKQGAKTGRSIVSRLDPKNAAYLECVRKVVCKKRKFLFF